MFCTLSAVILALLLLTSLTAHNITAPENLGQLFTLTGGLFILIFTLINSIVLLPLQKAEKNTTPRIIDLFKKDIRIFYINIYLLIFSLLNFLCAYTFISWQANQNALIAIWIVLLGIAADLLHHFFKRTLSYLNPFNFINILSEKAKKSILAERDTELCQWIDALTEIASKAIDRSSIALSSDAINEMQSIAKNFMESCKSIGHLGPETQAENSKKVAEEALGRDADEVSFLLFYISQRLEFIYDKALKEKLEPVCSTIISTLGKLAVFSAKFDLSLTSYPIHFIGKLTKHAQEKNFPEIGVKATLTLLEVGKIIINEVDFTYANLKEPFLSLITYLNEIAKTAFQQDKTLNISVLTQPLRDLKELLQTGKAAQHQDTPSIIVSIDRALSEFDALDMIMKTMPPLSEVTGQFTNPK